MDVTIEKLGGQGDGIAIVDGAEVFVPFSVPGERVSGDIVEDRMENPRILEPVEQRIKAMCRHFKTCGGCATQHIAPAYLADWKQTLVRDALKRQGLETTFRETITSPPHSRRRAVFTGKRTKSGAVLGFHGRASNQLVPIEMCSLLLPKITDAFDGLKDLVKLSATRKSEVRLAVTTSQGGLDVDLTQAKPMDSATNQAVVALVHAHQFARLFWNGDLILERQPAAQIFGGTAVTPPSGSFLQATAQGEAALCDAVGEIVGKAKLVADLFCGCGTFTLPLSRNAEVVGVEDSGSMLASLDKGWRQGVGLKRVDTLERDLFRNPLQADELKRFQAVVIDPPRAGAKEQASHLAGSTVPTIAFVSCNPATFARDARTLVDGGYTLAWVQVVDQFLWSGHCELVAKFHRT